MVPWWEVTKDVLLIVAAAVWLAGWLVYLASQLMWLRQPRQARIRKRLPWWYWPYAALWHAVWPVRVPLRLLQEQVSKPPRDKLAELAEIFKRSMKKQGEGVKALGRFFPAKGE